MIELNLYKFKGHRQSTLAPVNTAHPLVSISKPGQKLYTGKVDVVIPINSSLQIESGLRESFSLYSDSEWSSFRYSESISAAYASIRYKRDRFHFSSGLRMEHAHLKLKESMDNQSVTLLPNLSAQFDLPKQQGLILTYRKSVIRPRMYQLNPAISYTDPFTAYRGNPDLTASINTDITLDYSLNFKKNFISVGGFYEHTENSIENLTVLSGTGMFENSIENLGAISRIGIKVTGSIKPHKNILVNPSLKLYNFSSRGNTTAIENHIRDKRQMAVESGISVAATFKHDITVASILNYYSAKASIQGYRFEDVLYFISVEKSFKDKYKVGITSALPFMGEFTYQGYNTEGFQFTENAEDKLQLSLIPVWLKFTYNFSSGRKVGRNINDRGFEDPNQREGF